MIETRLQFLSLLDLADFQATVESIIHYYNTKAFTLTADFSEADIELAKAAFGAVVVTDDSDM